MKNVLVTICCLVCSIAFAQQKNIGIFQNNEDIGKPIKTGGASYDEGSQTYTLKGAGYNIWFERDEFNFLYNKIAGDFVITANFELVDKGTDPHRKVGLMVRESADEKAASINATLHGDGLTVLQWRELRGAFMRDPEDEIFPQKNNYTILQLERVGKNITMRAAHPGEPLQTLGSHAMTSFKDSVLVGLFISSHNK
ncbi:MAG TPA: hypothetical protein VIU13_04770, partial [Chryseolinea sp.]